MRILIIVIIALVVNTAPTAFNAEAECQCVCRYGPYGRVCHRVCSYPQPRYYRPPQPTYVPQDQHYQSAPYYAPVQSYANPFEIDSALTIAGVAILLVGLLAFLAGAFNDTGNEIASIEQSTLSHRAGAQDAENETHAINTYIANQEADAFERGRRRADEEWEEFTRV